MMVINAILLKLTMRDEASYYIYLDRVGGRPTPPRAQREVSIFLSFMCGKIKVECGRSIVRRCRTREIA
jgi:hypothetical protein